MRTFVQYQYHELSEEAKKKAVSEVWKDSEDLVEWSIVYEDLHTHVREICTMHGFKAEDVRIDEHFRGLDVETTIEIADGRKVFGKKMNHLYGYVQELSDGYIDIDIHAWREEASVAFDYGNVYPDDLLEINERHHRRIDLKYYPKYSFYGMVATEDEVYDRYRGEIEADFEAVGDYFCMMLQEKLNKKLTELFKETTDVIRATEEYYEGDGHIRDSLESEGSWIEESHRFKQDGTLVKDWEEEEEEENEEKAV
jgi:hypothetical protein